ncbi:MAG: hypothetical protein KF867_04460 [Cryobacterium sp.]|nr:hypothetical protein [Cryobacterium sp.]
MTAGIYFSLYIVLVSDSGMGGIYFLPRDLQTEAMFTPRKSLSDTARRAGWQGFMIDTDVAVARTVRVSDGDVVEFLVNV